MNQDYANKRKRSYQSYEALIKTEDDNPEMLHPGNPRDVALATLTLELHLIRLLMEHNAGLELKD